VIYPELIQFVHFKALQRCLMMNDEERGISIISLFYKHFFIKGNYIIYKWEPKNALFVDDEVGVSFLFKDINDNYIGFINGNSSDATKTVLRLTKKIQHIFIVVIGRGSGYASDYDLLNLNANDINEWINKTPMISSSYNPVFYLASWADWKENDDYRCCAVAKEIKMRLSTKTIESKNGNSLELWAYYTSKLMNTNIIRNENGKLLWMLDKWELAYWCSVVAKECKIVSGDKQNWKPFDLLFFKKMGGEYKGITCMELEKLYSAYFPKKDALKCDVNKKQLSATLTEALEDY